MKSMIKDIVNSLIKFSSSLMGKVLVLSVLFLLLVALIFTGKHITQVELHEGDISLYDIYAPYDFVYPGPLDEAKTEAQREKALQSFLPVYDLTVNYWDEKRKTLSDFFVEVSNVKSLKDVDDNWRIEKLKSVSNLEIENKLLLPFLAEEIDLLDTKGLSALNALSTKMIVDDAAIAALSAVNKEELLVSDKRLNVEAKVPRSELYAKDKLSAAVEKALASDGIKKTELREAFKSLLLSILTPNLIYNQAETEARRKILLDGLAPIYNQILVKKDELIIGKGERVTKNHLLKLEQFTKKETAPAKIAYLGGMILILALFVIAIPLYLSSYRKKIFAESKNLYLISIIVLLTIFIEKLVANSPLPAYFIPVASATMIAAMLLDYGTSFMLSIMFAVFGGLIEGNKFDVVVVLLVGGSAGVYFIKGVRRRSQILKAGLLVGLSEFVVICGIGLLNEFAPEVFLKEAYWGIASGIVSSGIVMCVLPVFESLFNVTTDITLLELSDLNHPILKKMVLSAPGTYHHSLVVGNLAEAASDAIGANSLLARVGAYYHDIGKIEKPEYYSENEVNHRSTHEKLMPSMSALVIQSHVKDGIELAKKYNLNKAIIDFIAQHHGTSLIYYFYQRALEKIEDDERLKEEAFRYAGPKPQTKEAAIVLLADAVEASSRALNDPTPSRIKGLVQKIINNKFIDNQLDECDLTLKDLNKIALAFVRILTAIFHTRVEYPEEDKSKMRKKG